MKNTNFLKKNIIYLCFYVLAYYLFVQKLYAANGIWYWNLGEYFGNIPFIVLTLLFFIFINIVDRIK